MPLVLEHSRHDVYLLFCGVYVRCQYGYYWPLASFRPVLLVLPFFFMSFFLGVLHSETRLLHYRSVSDFVIVL